MHHRSRIILFLLAAGFWAPGPRPVAAAEVFTFHHENVMGTALELRVWADDAGAAGRAEGRALREIDRLAAVFSGYDAASEFRRWQAAPRGAVKVSPELFAMLAACDRWRDASGGAFDPRVEALSRLWSDSAGRGRTPTFDERAAAKAQMAPAAWRLDAQAGTAERLTDCPLTLNAIAKGYIVELACEAACRRADGVRGLVLNVGGDLRVCGETQGTVGIAPPRGDSESAEPFAFIEVRDRAVATSGSSQRGFRINGRWYAHIFDPRTGRPAAAVVAATVIAHRSADADALATTLNVLPPEDGLRLVATVPGAECLIVRADGRLVRSPGWGRYERPSPTPLALAAAPQPAEPAQGTPKAAGGWGDEFELAINFEINRPETGGGGYRRPYVAVWAENKDGFPVRNLILWVSQGGSGPFQWIPDMKRWYRADQVRKRTDKTELVLTMSRPTRPPGKYSVVWDGKDDQGKPLPPGEYTVFIDAAREHGTYQGIRKAVTLADTPFAEDLPGNVEIRSAALAYRRKTPAK